MTDEKISDKKLLEDLELKNLDENIKILGIRHHLKASESYVDVSFTFPKESDRMWNGSIPYQYRRAGRFLETADQIIELISQTYVSLEADFSSKWIDEHTKLWNTKHQGKGVTKDFFMPMLNLEWNCVGHHFPANPNWARRIQDIKEMGYSLATNTKMWCDVEKKNTTHLLLLPLDPDMQTGYETISKGLRERILKVLGSYDAYEGERRPSRYLIPDHKFPEISWDENTKQDDISNLTDEEIKKKFQLLDNQRNLQKRESNRKTFQTGKRGTIYGIKFYSEGDEDWPVSIPRTGTNAEAGWVGSPWYDIEAWRTSLNRKLDAVRELESLLGHSIEKEVEKRKS